MHTALNAMFIGMGIFASATIYFSWRKAIPAYRHYRKVRTRLLLLPIRYTVTQPARGFEVTYRPGVSRR